MCENNEKEIKININKNINRDTETKFYKSYDFDIKYQLLSQIMKDIQLASQLIKSAKNSITSDIIFIKGNNLSII